MARIWWWKNEEKCCKQDDCIHCKQSHCIWMLTLLYSKKSSAFIDNVLEECIDISPQPWIFFIKMPKPLVWFSPPCSAFSYWIILQSQKRNVGKTTTEYHQSTPSFIDLDTVCLNKFCMWYWSSKKARLTLYEIYGGKYVTFCESWRNQAQFCTLWDFYDYDDGWAQWLCSPLTQAHLAKIDQLLLKAKGGKWESLVLGSSSTSRETTLGGK